MRTFRAPDSAFARLASDDSTSGTDTQRMSEAETIENGAEHLTPTGADEPIGLAHTEVSDVQGERISIDQSSVKSVSGKQVRINQSAVRKLDMESGTVTQSAAATLSSTDLAMHESAVGYVNAGRVDLFD